LYYGGRLAADGRRLGVLARSDADALKARGITIRMVDPRTDELREEISAPVAQVAVDPLKLDSAADVLVVAAKATVNEQLVEPIRALIRSDQTTILCLQNGMGNAEFLAAHFPRNPIVVGLCFVCVNRTAPAVVENYHPGRVEIGSLGDRWPGEAEAVADALHRAGVQVRQAASLDAALWRKLCWNIPFNGLSIVAGGVTTDRILADPQLAGRARRLMEEVREAAGRAGHAIDDAFLDGQFAVTEKMAAYKPSSLIDYLERKPVEVQAIWGVPLNRGRDLGAAMPELEALYGELVAAVNQRLRHK
jgi:2-dehydropantoate 2-reductase